MPSDAETRKEYNVAHLTHLSLATMPLGIMKILNIMSFDIMPYDIMSFDIEGRNK
jgi:hypothetical protein